MPVSTVTFRGTDILVAILYRMAIIETSFTSHRLSQFNVSNFWPRLPHFYSNSLLSTLPCFPFQHQGAPLRCSREARHWQLKIAPDFGLVAALKLLTAGPHSHLTSILILSMGIFENRGEYQCPF
jgi:hypothetical protein